LFIPYNNYYEVRTNGKYKGVPIDDKVAGKKLNIDDGKISILLDDINISDKAWIVYFTPGLSRKR